MEVNLIWKDGMEFCAETTGHLIHIDAKAPIGKNSGPTPKELVVMGLGGCTGMDVAALLKKAKEPIENFSIHCDVTSSEGSYPTVFTKVHLTYSFTGNLHLEKLVESVHLSQSKYCGVSAMLSKAFPITWSIKLNGEIVANGESHFPQ